MSPLVRLALMVVCACGSWLTLAPQASAATFTVDTTKDGVDANTADTLCATAGGKCTLRAAIEEANAQSGNDEIVLPKGTFKLSLPKAPAPANSEGELDVTEAAEIDGRGPGKTVIRQTVKDRVLRNDASLAFSSAT
jgi:CSLREA domain-containing protein